MEYREIIREDIKLLSPLFMESFNSEPFNEIWTIETATKRLEHTFGLNDFYGLSAWEEGKLCGFIMGQFEPFYDNKEFVVKEFAVNNAMRGNGIGSKIINEFEKRLKEKGVKNITLLTLKGNLTEGFYNKNGYKQNCGIIFMNKRIDNVIKVLKGDITKMENVDAIVNAANSSLLGGGGVDGAIHRAAGKELLAECRILGGCKTGQAKITKGYNLKCKYIIHTVGPVFRGGENGEEQLLKDCYINSLKLAIENGIRKIAFPAISTGIYGYPQELAAKTVINTVKEFIDKNAYSFDEIIFVLFDDYSKELYEKLIAE